MPAASEPRGDKPGPPLRAEALGVEPVADRLVQARNESLQRQRLGGTTGDRRQETVVAIGEEADGEVVA